MKEIVSPPRTDLKMLQIFIVRDLNVEIRFDLFEQRLLFLLQPSGIHSFENPISAFDASRQFRRFDRIVRDEFLHRFEQHFVLGETRHDARKIIFQRQTTAERIQFAQLTKGNSRRNRDGKTNSRASTQRNRSIVLSS